MEFRNFINSIKNNNIKEVKSFLNNKDFNLTNLDNLAIESSINVKSKESFEILINDSRFNLSAKDNNALFISLFIDDDFFFQSLIKNKSIIDNLTTQWINNIILYLQNDTGSYFPEHHCRSLKKIEVLQKIININTF
jgi:hypothetical protein